MTEDALSTDLGFRGQGRASLCYAFSEEQVLKDVTCTDSNCDYNASEWKYSIFDIARIHQQLWIKLGNRITADLSRDLLGNGSNAAFPYERVGAKNVRASKCTLEREVFFLNRSPISNPRRGEEPRDILADYLIRIYLELRSDRDRPSPFKNPEIVETWSTLKNLALLAKDEFDFLSKVIDFTKCEDRLPLPRFKVESRDLVDRPEVQALLESRLLQKQSLYVGVCSEVLATETTDSNPCGRHAVVLRRFDPIKKEVLVVDSAFFSKRPRNPDGSNWIPEDVIVKAIVKSGEDARQIREKTKKQFAEMLTDEEIRRNAEETLADIRALIVPQLKEDQQFKALLIEVLNQNISPHPKESLEYKLYAPVLKAAQSMEFRNLNDLKKLLPVLENSLKTMSQIPDALDAISFNGIVWLEPSR